MEGLAELVVDPVSVVRPWHAVPVAVAVAVVVLVVLVDVKARIRVVAGDDSSNSGRMAVVAAAADVGRDKLAAGSAGMQGASMDVVVVSIGADWSATGHEPSMRH